MCRPTPRRFPTNSPLESACLLCIPLTTQRRFFCPAFPVRLGAQENNNTAIMNDEDKIMDISKKIEREKALMQAASVMRQQTTNEAVLSKLDTQMREGKRNLEFFENRLRELQMRRVGHGMDNMSLGHGGSSASRPKSSDMDREGPPPPPPKDSSGFADRTSQGSGQSGLMPRQHPFPGQPPDSGVPKSRPNFTKLGLFRPPRSIPHSQCRLLRVF